MTKRVREGTGGRRAATRLAMMVALASALMQCASTRVRVAAPPDLDVRPIAFRSGSGSDIRGWLVRGRPRAGAVVLLHGIGATRSAMLDRARFLNATGYSVLLIDFRAHGESTGDETTYGGLESQDARAAVDFVRDAFPGEPVGVIGISMGGAAALLGPAPLPCRRSCSNRCTRPSVTPCATGSAHGSAPSAPPSRRSCCARSSRATGHPADLRPIDRIGEQTAPVLVVAGTADPYTTRRESRELFERARAPKGLWEVEDAAHVDLHAFAPAEYEHRIGEFLAQNLRATSAGAPGAVLLHGPSGLAGSD
jgi:pimeloyl-ACP methyl ester carboxylesterase